MPGCVKFSTSKFPRRSRGCFRKLRAAKRRFLQLLRLDHRAHGAVQNDDPLLQEMLQRGESCISSIQRTSPISKVALELAGQANAGHTLQ